MILYIHICMYMYIRIHIYIYICIYMQLHREQSYGFIIVFWMMLSWFFDGSPAVLFAQFPLFSIQSSVAFQSQCFFCGFRSPGLVTPGTPLVELHCQHCDLLQLSYLNMTLYLGTSSPDLFSETGSMTYGSLPSSQ